MKTSNTDNAAMSKPAFLALLGICAASFLGHLALLPLMPESVPTHWDAAGNVNGWSSPIVNLAFCALPFLLAIILYVAPKVDPKGANYARFGNFYGAFAIGLTLFIAAVTWTTEATAFGLMPENGSPVGVIVSLVMGIALIALGNYLPRVKPNYTFGIRTPWALHDEQNWRLTHRFGGAITLVMGIVLIAVAAVAFATAGGDTAGASGLATTLLLVVILGGSAAMFVYSYLVYRNDNKPLLPRK